MLNEAHLPPSNLMQVDFVETAIDASLFCMLGPAQLIRRRKLLMRGVIFEAGHAFFEPLKVSMWLK
jgi:hypothetical protein